MAFVGIGGARIGVAGVSVVAVEELDDVESEPIHVEVDVARLEIGRAGLPDANLGVESFDGVELAVRDVLELLEGDVDVGERHGEISVKSEE